MNTISAIAMNDSLPVTDSAALVVVDVPEPEVREHDVLVRVRAVSINPVDVKIRAGAGQQDEPKILGWDAAGVIEKVGSAVEDFHVGDEVYYAGDLTRSGTNAELHAVDQRLVAAKPKTLSFAEAAALPLTAITAWETLFDHMKLTSSSEGTLLVVGGAGGVGSLVIQLARWATKLRVVATASRPQSREWCLEMGAHEIVDHSRALAPQMKELGSADYVFSAYTTGREQDIADSMNPQGHLVLIDDPSTFDIGAFKSRSVSVTPEFMFTRSMFETADMSEQGRLLKLVSQAIDAGELRGTQTRNLDGFNVENFLAAHGAVEDGHAVGKITISF